MELERDALIRDNRLVGSEFAQAYRDRVDAWLVHVFHEATSNRPGCALVALGGYGRRELSPGSDLDVLLLHDRLDDVGQLADRLWYPVWDEGLKLGHSVRTVKEALSLASDDLDSATALLSARHLAGDQSLTSALLDQARTQWEREGKLWLSILSTRTEERHARYGEVAFLLEPDLKEGRGGLRDVHAMGWAEATGLIGWFGDTTELRRAHDLLFDARVELHRRTGRADDRLLLQDQDAVAEALGDGDADDLMRRVSAAARHIAWTSDEAWRRLVTAAARGRSFRSRHDEPVSDDFVLRDGEIELSDTARLEDPALALRASLAAVENETRVGRSSLDAMAVSVPPMPDPWPENSREALIALLGTGTPAIAAFEALDQFGLLDRVLPEWKAVRCLPQRNAYHTFTVDRHLCEAASNASRLVGRVDRPDLLLVGTWLHDIGKGFPGDHTEVGMELVAGIARRMGFGEEDTATLVTLVEHHLLLPDVATRRDLDDEVTISIVAESCGSRRTLHLLAALTEADSIATGPSAWGTWKSELVATLVDRVDHVLGGGAAGEVTDEFPTEDHEHLVVSTGTVIEGTGDVLTLATDDRHGLFARVTGVLALNGIDVMEARVGTVGDRAIEVFRVQSSAGPVIRWDRVERDLRSALTGRLAITARLAERERAYARRVPVADPVTPTVSFHHADSEDATVVEVLAADAIGVLFRMATAFVELDLDIVKAKVQTLGHAVVDTFYVRSGDGSKLDEDHAAELERALIQVLVRG